LPQLWQQHGLLLTGGSNLHFEAENLVVRDAAREGDADCATSQQIDCSRQAAAADLPDTQFAT
jgi:hypothetical protein